MDLLAFGPHPDDIEIGMGATIAHHVTEGFDVGLCDLTAGELGSNGTPAERLAEAELARATLGGRIRWNLGLPDGRINEHDQDQLLKVVTLIRRERPRVVTAPYWEDRHPDHVGASQLLSRAVYLSHLRRYAPEHPPWRVEWLCYYFINDTMVRPSFVIDVSDHYESKRNALACYRSQFQQSSETLPTRINTPAFMQVVESRDAQFGAANGARFAEGFVVRHPLVRSTLMPLAADRVRSSRDETPARP